MIQNKMKLNKLLPTHYPKHQYNYVYILSTFCAVYHTYMHPMYNIKSDKDQR